MKGDLSLSMGPVQVKINEKFRLETSDIYGSLFEFLDGNDFKMSEGKELQERLTSLKVQVHSKLKQEQEGVAIIPALRPRSCTKDKLASVLKNMSDNVGNRDLQSVSYSSVDEERNDRRSLNHNSFCSKRVSLLDKDNSRNIANRRSTLSPEGQQDTSLLANINDVNNKKSVRNKKVSFQDGTFKENQKLDYSNVESRVARYLRKKTSVLKGGEKEVALWNMYQIEGQNKKALFLQYELNLLNKLAIKGEHHILKAQREVAKEGEEQNNPVHESYNKSFMRMKEGLKQLREKKQSRQYFDEDGNYISYAASKAKPGQNASLPTAQQTQNSFYSSPMGVPEKKNLNESNRSIGFREPKRQGSETRRRDNSPGVTFSSFGVRGDDEDMHMEGEKKAPKKPKSKKLYLIGIDNNKWIGNHRTREKKEEVEKIINQKDQLDSVTYMQKIRETNVRAQKAQLKKIEEELIEKMGPRWRKRPHSVMRFSR